MLSRHLLRNRATYIIVVLNVQEVLSNFHMYISYIEMTKTSWAFCSFYNTECGQTQD